MGYFCTSRSYGSNLIIKKKFHRAMFLRQLGYFHDQLPCLHIYIQHNNDRADKIPIIHCIEDPELPFWTGNRFKRYMASNYHLSCDYYIGDTKLDGDNTYLYELGLRPGFNIAFPYIITPFLMLKEEYELPECPTASEVLFGDRGVTNS